MRAILLLAACASLISATPLCKTASMAVYIQQRACQIGNITFSFGTHAYIFAGDDINVGFARIILTPTGTGLAGVPTGFTFAANNSGWTATNPDARHANEADINITFDASVAVPRAALNTAAAALDPNLVNFSAGDTGILFGEDVIDLASRNTVGAINLTLLGNTSAQSMAAGGSALSASSGTFSSTSIEVNKDVDILALDPHSSASLTKLTDTVTYGIVPEPVRLTAFGLLLLGCWRIYRRHA